MAHTTPQQSGSQFTQSEVDKLLEKIKDDKDKEKEVKPNIIQRILKS